jgi:flagellar biosynthesis protein FlhA
VFVTRVANDEDVGQQMVSQLFTNPRVMVLSAAVLGLFGLVPGMPNFVFLLFTVGLLALAWWLRGKEEKAPAEVTPVKMPENNQAVEATWNDVQLEDSLGMEVGYRLIPMVDFQQDGELLGRIRSIRKKFAQDMGFLPPVVHIRDNMDLPPARYRILMKGVEVGSGDAYPGRWLAINPGTAAGSLPGEQTVDPAFGLAAIWIESALKEQAQIQGFTVVEASTVVATHLNHLIGQFAPELFGRQEAQQLLDRVTQEMPKLTEDLVPGVVTLTTLHKVLQNLLAEKVPIRDMRTILETLAEHAPLQTDPYELTTVVRVRWAVRSPSNGSPAAAKCRLLVLIRHWSVCCYRHCKAAVGWSRALPIVCWSKLRKRCSVRRCLARRPYCWSTMRCVRCCLVSCVAACRSWWCCRIWKCPITVPSG